MDNVRMWGMVVGIFWVLVGGGGCGGFILGSGG